MLAALTLTLTQPAATCLAAGTPTEVHLLPVGSFRSADGRPSDAPAWQLDAAQAGVLISTAAARTNPYVLDYEHQTLHAAQNGQPAPAAGWFKQLEWRPDSGLYATDVQWTPRALAHLNAGEYRYLSTVFEYQPKTGRVLKLRHAALTNDPALDGLAALAALKSELSLSLPGAELMPPKILELLGLAPDADEAAVIAALTALLEKAAAAETQMTALKTSHVPMTALHTLQAELAALKAEANQTAVEGLIGDAKADGRLLPALEPWARELGKTNLAALKNYLAAAVPLAALKGLQTGGLPPAGGGGEAELPDPAILRQLQLTPEQFAKGKVTL